MNTKFLLLIGFFLFSGGPKTIAQTLDSETKTEAIIYRYEPTLGQSNFQNMLLQRLNQGTNKYVSNMMFEFRYTLSSELKRNNNNLNAKATLKPEGVIGDTYYKGFSVSNWIQPDLFSVQFTVKNMKTNVYTKKIENLDFTQGKRGVAAANFKDTTSIGYKLVVKEYNIVFSEERQEFVNRQLNMIDEYYNLMPQLDAAMSDLQNVDPQNMEFIEQEQVELAPIIQFLDFVSQRGFVEQLDLQYFDPIAFMPKFTILQNTFFQKQQAIEQALLQRDAYHYQVGLDFLQDGNPQEAANRFVRSLSFNPNFLPSKFELAKLNFSNGNTEAAEQTFYFIYQNAPRDQLFGAVVNEFQKVYDYWIQTGKQSLTNTDNQNAISAFQHANYVCNQIAEIRCTSEIQNGLIKANTNIYYQKLQNVEQALQVNNLQEADALLNQAKQFRGVNNLNISLDAENRLQRKVGTAFFTVKMQQAQQALTAKNFESALNQFESAQEYALQNGLTVPQEIYTLKTQSARGSIFQTINTINYALNTQKSAEESFKQINSIKRDINKIKELQYNYDLQSDAEINQQLSAYNEQFFSIECNYFLERERELVEEFNALKNSLEYLAAKDSASALLQLCRNESQCNLNEYRAQKLIQEVEAPAQFMVLMNQLNQHIDYSDHEKVKPAFEAASSYFVKNNIQQFGLSMPTFDAFVQSKATSSYLVYLVKEQLAVSNAPKAFEYLKLLRSRNYSVKYSRPLQEQLGVALLQHDAKKDGLLNYKLKIIEYTAGDKWYKYFAKAYKKAYKAYF